MPNIKKHELEKREEKNEEQKNNSKKILIERIIWFLLSIVLIGITYWLSSSD